MNFTNDKESTAEENSPTLKRLKNKITYSKSEFEKISIDAFKFKPIQDIMKIWETTNQIAINKEADEVIENIKFWNQKIMSWNNYRFINRISENWKDRKSIDEKLTDKSIKRVKQIDLSERENDDTLKFKIKDEHIINNDEKYELLKKENVINTNALRVLPSTTDISVLTSVFDHSKGKWLESSRASHPFISVAFEPRRDYSRLIEQFVLLLSNLLFVFRFTRR